jgi:hypothetical protein
MGIEQGGRGALAGVPNERALGATGRTKADRSPQRTYVPAVGATSTAWAAIAAWASSATAR